MFVKYLIKDNQYILIFTEYELEKQDIDDEFLEKYLTDFFTTSEQDKVKVINENIDLHNKINPGLKSCEKTTGGFNISINYHQSLDLNLLKENNAQEISQKTFRKYLDLIIIARQQLMRIAQRYKENRNSKPQIS